jgi:hypothetical protein
MKINPRNPSDSMEKVIPPICGHIPRPPPSRLPKPKRQFTIPPTLPSTSLTSLYLQWTLGFYYSGDCTGPEHDAFGDNHATGCNNIDSSVTVSSPPKPLAIFTFSQKEDTDIILSSCRLKLRVASESRVVITRSGSMMARIVPEMARCLRRAGSVRSLRDPPWVFEL